VEIYPEAREESPMRKLNIHLVYGVLQVD